MEHWKRATDHQLSTNRGDLQIHYWDSVVGNTAQFSDYQLMTDNGSEIRLTFLQMDPDSADFDESTIEARPVARIVLSHVQARRLLGMLRKRFPEDETDTVGIE